MTKGQNILTQSQKLEMAPPILSSLSAMCSISALLLRMHTPLPHVTQSTSF